MTRRTQIILYHTLPIVFWLSAGVGSVLPLFFLPSLQDGDVDGLLAYFCPALLALISVMIIRHIRRHASSVEQCFQVAVLLGIASYWLPTVLCLIPPIWIYLITRNIYSLRSFFSTLLGLALVAVWMTALSLTGIIETPSLVGRAGVGYWSWLPTGSILIAYIASTIVRQNLRVR